MTTTTQEQGRPPMPAFLFKITNPLIKLMLLSPLHKGMSDKLMVLRWTGRKSGKRFSTPVGYVRDGDTILVFTHSRWYKNFSGAGAPVAMRIQGQDVRGHARLVSDPDRVRAIVRALNRFHGPDMAKRMGFYVPDTEAPPESILAATEGTRFVEIEVKG